MNIADSCGAFLTGQLSNDALCRAVVRHPTWHLLVNDQNCPWFWEISGKNNVVALTENRPVNGVHAKSVVMSGRVLLRSIGQDAQGIALELGTEHAVSFSRAEIDGDLRHYVSAIDCEEALHEARGSAAQILANHNWLLVMDGDKPFIDEPNEHALVYAFTTPDALATWRGQRPTLDALTIKWISGNELFATVACMQDADGLQINPEFQLFPPLAPFVLNALAHGVDSRFDVRVLPAHTIAEIYTFLDQMQVYCASIEHEMVYRNDELVARYRGVAAGGRLVSFDFTPVQPTDDPLHIGVHKSEILCPGWLASKLIDVLQVLPDDPAELTHSDVELLQNGMRWIAQMWALLDDRPAIPHAELLTVAGAAAVRRHPQIVTQDLIDRVFSRLADYERERGVPAS